MVDRQLTKIRKLCIYIYIYIIIIIIIIIIITIRMYCCALHLWDPQYIIFTQYFIHLLLALQQFITHIIII